MEFVYIIIVQFVMSANIQKSFGLQIVLVCLNSTPPPPPPPPNLIIIIVQTCLKALNL